jgi:hypothetical protein
MASRANYNGNLLKWDITLSRAYDPHYYISSGERAYTDVRPITISVNVEVDDSEVAKKFEEKVREILETL